MKLFKFKNVTKEKINKYRLYGRCQLAGKKGGKKDDSPKITDVLLKKMNLLKNLYLKKKMIDNATDRSTSIVSSFTTWYSDDKNKDYISRKNIYTKYKSFKNFKGKLLKQQVFLEDFINDNYDLIDKMLIFIRTNRFINQIIEQRYENRL
jgi:hypothetical protein